MEKQILQAVTQNCNLACEYCRRHSGNTYDMFNKEENAVEFERDKWPLIKEIIINNDVKRVMLTGGEPLEYSLLLEYCKFLLSLNVKVIIHTNGLSKNGLMFLDAIHKLKMRVDFHVSSELFLDIQKKLRGDQLPVNFIEHCRFYGYNVRLKVTMTNLLCTKIDELEDCFYWWKEIGISTIIFQPIVYINDKVRKDIYLTSDFIKVIDKIEGLGNEKRILKNMLHNSKESWQALKEILNGENVPIEIINKCITYEKMLSLDTNLNIGNCKSLWNKDVDASCQECFDLVCCGFIA